MKIRREERSQCSNCGANARVVRGRYKFVESGLKNVELLGIDVIRCPKCKNVDPIIPNVNDLMRLLAVAVLSKPARLKGAEVRFLRKYLGMTGAEFSKLIHVDKGTLSKWENDEDPIGEQSDRLIRAVTLGLGDGLKERLESIIRMFGEIKESKDLDIHLDAASGKYAYA